MNAVRRHALAGGVQRWIGWIAGAGTFLLLVATLWSRAFPALPTRLTLRATFPVGIAGRAEPLITTGIPAHGDLLAVRYLDERTAVILYDVWGVGGPTSQPFELQPGVSRLLEIEMPTLAPVPSFTPRERRPLRVAIDGREILSGAEYFHRRRPHEISFARNAIGGTITTGEFRGTLSTLDGRSLRGGAETIFAWQRRLPSLFATSPWQILFYLLLSLAVGWAARRCAAWLARNTLADLPVRTFIGRPKPAHGCFIATALGCSLVFADLVTGGTFEFFVEESFGTFYDHQARSMLNGRFDVPEAAISGEAFVLDGKFYGYFGITPSLLRLPLLTAESVFGQLSRLYLLGYFIACLGAAYALLCHATRRLCGQNAWPSAGAIIVFLSGGVLGTTFLFLGSRAYIYHEAILCGAALALWSSFFSLRYLETPAGKSWIGALLCGLFAIHARPPSGLYALCLLGAVASVHLISWWKTRPAHRASRPVLIGIGATLAILSFNGVSYLKFRTFDGSPLRYSVQYTPERVAKFGGKNFHLSNLHHNLDTYLLRPDFHLEPDFPFFYMGALQSRGYPEAKIDLEEPALGFPFAMPFLFALATLGAGWAACSAPPARLSLLVLVAGVGPMALALGTAIVTSHRYTGDFCPFLIACAAWGMAAFDAEASRWRKAFLAAATALATLSLLITLALALRFQGELVWGATEETKTRYQQLSRRVNEFFRATPP